VYTNRPDVVGLVDLAGSILALDAICRFLRLRAPYETLNLLLNGLRDLAEGGSPAAMFLPLERTKGRRPDVPTVMAAKGMLAAVMHGAHFGKAAYSPRLDAYEHARRLHWHVWLDRRGYCRA
jgi:hypothetical protein